MRESELTITLQKNAKQINDIIGKLYSNIIQITSDLPSMYSKRIEKEGTFQYKRISNLTKEMCNVLISMNEKDSNSFLEDETNNYEKKLMELIEETRIAFLEYVRYSTMNTTYIPETMSVPVFEYEDRTMLISKIQNLFLETFNKIQTVWEDKNIESAQQINKNSQEISQKIDIDSNYKVDIKNIEELLIKQQIKTSGVRQTVKDIKNDLQIANSKK